MDNVKELRLRQQALARERQSWEADWRKLAAHFSPGKFRLDAEPSRQNRGGIRDDKLDSTAMQAMRDLAAGMHGGLTSPARPWFRLKLEDEETSGQRDVRAWLDEVEDPIRAAYHNSDFYTAVSSFYTELATFGTAFQFEEADANGNLRFTTLTAGEYWLDTDDTGRVDTVFRALSLTLRQLAMKFGEENLPEQLRRMHADARHHNTRYRVMHAVFPREQAVPESSGNANDGPLSRGRTGSGDAVPSLLGDGFMQPGAPAAVGAEAAGDAASVSVAEPWRFASVYYLDGHGGGRKPWREDEAVLGEEGFYEFPGFGVRWDVTGQDVYGRGPAYLAVADSILLQQINNAALRALHLQIEPPMGAPDTFENLSLLPGAINPVPWNASGSHQAIYPLIQVRPDLNAAWHIISQKQRQIRECLFTDLFKMLLSSDRRNITAKEVSAREEEKMLLLGPVLERLHYEYFIPLSERTFNLLWRAGRLPGPPESILDQGIKVEFVSILAQAQKMVSTGSVEQMVGMIGRMSQLYPEALDALDADAVVDEYADDLGVPAGILRGQDDRDDTRRARQEAQARQQEMQQVMQGVRVASEAGLDVGELAGMAG